jgi:threonine/homoserine/homoserine lactone efflux protein
MQTFTSQATFPLSLVLTSMPFLASMGFTPGPNNIMVASSGVNFGFRATIPHILGITVGFPLMLLVVGLGLARIFIAIPWVHAVLKYVSIVYLVYLSWRIATAAEPRGRRKTARPITFMQAIAFQWVNVKAWIVALSAVTTYTVVNPTLPWQVGAIAVLDVVITLGCVSCWTLFGHFLRTYLHTESRRRWFNRAMATLLLGSILPVLWE